MTNPWENKSHNSRMNWSYRRSKTVYIFKGVFCKLQRGDKTVSYHSLSGHRIITGKLERTDIDEKTTPVSCCVEHGFFIKVMTDKTPMKCVNTNILNNFCEIWYTSRNGCCAKLGTLAQLFCGYLMQMTHLPWSQSWFTVWTVCW